MDEKKIFLEILDEVHANCAGERKAVVSSDVPEDILEELELNAMNTGKIVVYPFLKNKIIFCFSLKYDEKENRIEKRFYNIPIGYRLCKCDEEDLILFIRESNSVNCRRDHFLKLNRDLANIGVLPSRYGINHLDKAIEYLYFTTHDNALKCLWEADLVNLARQIGTFLPNIINFSGKTPEEVIKVPYVLLNALNNETLVFYLRDEISFRTMRLLYENYISEKTTRSLNLAQFKYIELIAAGLFPSFSQELFQLLSEVKGREDNLLSAYCTFFKYKDALSDYGFSIIHEIPFYSDITILSSLMKALMLMSPAEERLINDRLILEEKIYCGELQSFKSDKFTVKFSPTLKEMCRDRINVGDYRTLERDINSVLACESSAFFTVFEKDSMRPAFAIRIDKSSLISAIYTKKGLTKDEYIYLRNLIVDNTKLAFDGDSCCLDDYADRYEEDSSEKIIETKEEYHPSFDVVFAGNKAKKIRKSFEKEDVSEVTFLSDFIGKASCEKPVFILIDTEELEKDEITQRRIFNFVTKNPKALIIGILWGSGKCNNLPFFHSIEMKKEDIPFPIMALVAEAHQNGYERELRRMISSHSKVSYLKGDITNDCEKKLANTGFARMYQHTAYSLFAILKMKTVADAFKTYKVIKALEKEYDDSKKDLVICDSTKESEELLIIYS